MLDVYRKADDLDDVMILLKGFRFSGLSLFSHPSIRGMMSKDQALRECSNIPITMAPLDFIHFLSEHGGCLRGDEYHSFILLYERVYEKPI